MERGDDGGVVSGNRAGWTQAQGCARNHHGRGESAEQAVWSRLCPFGAACSTESPRRFVGQHLLQSPFLHSPSCTPPLPAPLSQPDTAIAPTERPHPSAAVAAERGRWRPPP